MPRQERPRIGRTPTGWWVWYGGKDPIRAWRDGTGQCLIVIRTTIPWSTRQDARAAARDINTFLAEVRAAPTVSERSPRARCVNFRTDVLREA